MGVLVTVILPLGLAIIMLSLGLGLTFRDFTRVARQPKAFLIGAVNQIVIVPLVALVIIALFGLSGPIAVGVLILSLCPGGVTTNMLSKLAKGDVALSVSLTAIISLVSMLYVPIIVFWGLRHFMGADFMADALPDIAISDLALSMFLITTLPVSIGVLLRHFRQDIAEKLEPIISKIAIGLFILIVIAAIAANFWLLIESLAQLGPALIALNLLLLAIGFFSGRVLGLTGAQAKTIAIETGIQNSTIGIAIGGLIGGTLIGGFSAFALPAALYSVTMYLVTLPMIIWARGRFS